MNKEYIITVFSENKVGLLSQITTVFTCRDINIESLTTSESSIPGIHKFTIVVITDPEKIEKLVKQIEKKIDVLKAFVFTPDEVVQQEIALYKVTRSNSVEKLVRDHHVRILEICDDYIVLEKIRTQRGYPVLCSNYYNPMGYSNSSGRAKLRSSNQNANY